jgi:hypothetical protein
LDLEEMKSFKDCNEELYLEWFDQRFITYGMLESLHASVERLAEFFQRNNHLSLSEEVSRLLPEYEALRASASQRYEGLFGQELPAQ